LAEAVIASHACATTSLVTVSAVAGVVGPILFAITLTALSYLCPGYNPLTQTISELGATNAPTMELQALNFAILGVPTAIFAIGLGVYDRHFRSTSILVGLYGIGTLLVAGLPCDPGCSFKGTSLVQIAHSLDALFSFVVFAFAPLFFWRSSRTAPKWTKTPAWSLRVAIVSILMLVGYLAITALALSSTAGLVQRIFLGLLFAWMIMIAYKMARLATIDSGHSFP